MMKEWSKEWNTSKQPRKQRKYVYNAPTHARRKRMAARLSKELSSNYGKRSAVVTNGDEVLVMRGSFKGKKGKVNELDYTNYAVFIDSVRNEKADGTKVKAPIHPSNVMITKLSLDDPKRVKALSRKAEVKKE